MYQKLAPDHFLILLNNQKQPLNARNSFWNKIFCKKIIKNPLKSWLYVFFQTQSLLMDEIIKHNRGLVALQITKQVQKYSLICYTLSEQVWWCIVKQLLSYSKNCICKFMQVNWWHHKSFHFHLSFWIWKLWRGRAELQKFEYLENEKSFLDEIKNIFL